MKPMRVAAVSTKNWIGQPSRSIRNMAAWARKAAKKGAEMIVFPELGVNGYFKSTHTWDVAETIPGPSVDKLVSLADEVKAILCFGILERDADVVYNTQVFVNGDGIIGMQRKVHMPGLEYLYWRGGFEVNAIDVGKARVGVTICFDSVFSELCRTLYFDGAEIFVMPFAYNTMARARFPERDINAMMYRVHCNSNGCYGILVNNAGTRRKTKQEGSKARFPGWAGVIGPDGSVVAFTRGKGNGEAMVVADLDPEEIAKRRRSSHFAPRCLRPEMYAGPRPANDAGRRLDR